MDQVLARRQAVVEARRFREQPDPRAQLRTPGAACRDLAAGHPCPAGVRRQQPGEHAQRGGFSGAVRPEKAEDLAPLHGEGDLAARRTAAERFAEPVRLDRRQAAAILPLCLARRLARHGAKLRTPLEGRECGARQTWWWSAPAITASSPHWCWPAAGSTSWSWRRRRSSAAPRAPNRPSRGSRGL